VKETKTVDTEHAAKAVAKAFFTSAEPFSDRNATCEHACVMQQVFATVFKFSFIKF